MSVFPRSRVLQRDEQPVVIALMQADRRLIEHVHDADEARPDLGREVNPLGLAAG